MTVWTASNLTSTAVIASELTYLQTSTANSFQLRVDTTNMVNGDTTEIRVYSITNTTARVEALGIYANIQAIPMKRFGFTASEGIANGCKLTIKQTGGTGRSYDAEMLIDNGAGAANVTQIAGVPVGTTTAHIGVNVVSVAGAASNVKKNQALAGFTFLMTNSTTHAPATGLTVTATRSLDGAAFGACANAVSEIANGLYKIDLAAGDLNGNNVLLRFTAALSDDQDILVITQP